MLAKCEATGLQHAPLDCWLGMPHDLVGLCASVVSPHPAPAAPPAPLLEEPLPCASVLRALLPASSLPGAGSLRGTEKADGPAGLGACLQFPSEAILRRAVSPALISEAVQTGS